MVEITMGDCLISEFSNATIVVKVEFINGDHIALKIIAIVKGDARGDVGTKFNHSTKTVARISTKLSKNHLKMYELLYG